MKKTIRVVGNSYQKDRFETQIFRICFHFTLCFRNYFLKLFTDQNFYFKCNRLCNRLCNDYANRLHSCNRNRNRVIFYKHYRDCNRNRPI